MAALLDGAESVFLDHLAYDDAFVFLAEEEEEVAGLASLWLRPRLGETTLEAWIPDLFVTEAFRRRGLARALLDACVTQAKRRGCKAVRLECDGEGAQKLCESYGFADGGRAYRLEL